MWFAVNVCRQARDKRVLGRSRGRNRLFGCRARFGENTDLKNVGHLFGCIFH